MLISNNIKQFHNIWTPADVLKYFYLPFDLYKYTTGSLRTSSPRKLFLFNESARHDMVRISFKATNAYVDFEYSNSLRGWVTTE
jgi:hypothetical protein